LVAKFGAEITAINPSPAFMTLLRVAVVSIIAVSYF
jgi:hypothetical protein